MNDSRAGRRYRFSKGAKKKQGSSGLEFYGSRRSRGAAGETRARRYLEGKGYRIVEANFRTRYGEIDLIARQGDVVAFIEVKARRSLSCGAPHEAVGSRKQRQIRRMAEMWLAARQSDALLCSCTFRFDVIAIIFNPQGEASLKHFKDAFR